MHWESLSGARPDATAAVHTHGPAATAFGITNQKFPPINTDAIFLADTQIVPWFMPGSKELADAVDEALKVSRGAILQCHGLMAVGKTMRDAATRAMMLEETAKLLLYCKQFGGELALIPRRVGRAPRVGRELPLKRPGSDRRPHARGQAPRLEQRSARRRARRYGGRRLTRLTRVAPSCAPYSGAMIAPARRVGGSRGCAGRTRIFVADQLARRLACAGPIARSTPRRAWRGPSSTTRSGLNRSTTRLVAWPRSASRSSGDGSGRCT